MILATFAVLMASCVPVGPQRSEGVSIPGTEETALTSKKVEAAFTDAGLEARKPRPMTREDFGAAPMRTKDATLFLIPFLASDLYLGGRAFVFDSVANLRATKNYFDKFRNYVGPFFFSRTFANIDRLVLVQIEGHMTEKKKARKYRAVVNDL